MTNNNTPNRPKLSLKKTTGLAQSPKNSRIRSGARARIITQRALANGEKIKPKSALAQTQATQEQKRNVNKNRHRQKAQETFSSKPTIVSHHTQDDVNEHPNQPIQRDSRISTRPSLNDKWPMFATCPQGMEEALAQELNTLGLAGVTKGRAGCAFESDLAGMMRANLHSRLATRILLQLAKAPVHNENDIYQLARDVTWENWFGAEHKLRVDTSAIRSPMKSLQFCNLRVKDGICDRLRDREGARPSIDTVRPDARVQLFLTKDEATIYLDTSGESLFKRGWRLDKGEAPLRENLAAALLLLSQWDKKTPLYDPFCGSATILIEAVWMAQNVPPGIFRPFGFERTRYFNERLWGAIKEEAFATITTPLDVLIFGSDIDNRVLKAAHENIERAHLSNNAIHLSVQDARQALPPCKEKGLIICNPPYGERLGTQDEVFWQAWASQLKSSYSGWQVNAITSDLDMPSKMRLRPNRRTPLYNGPLDCRLFSFNMVEGKHE